ncbi:MAG TPA: gliding motility protein GldC [Marinilabiliaceae bacterium]|nr:gliding motility protein GldC [Marinilabiliaceae bacterium]
MTKHKISLNVTLDPEKMPEHIDWTATGSPQETPTPAKAFLLSIWDPAEKTALSIDLWTKRMMVDEMNDFFFQSMMTMANTYGRATKNEDLSEELKAFAREFKKKADQKIIDEQNK